MKPIELFFLGKKSSPLEMASCVVSIALVWTELSQSAPDINSGQTCTTPLEDAAAAAAAARGQQVCMPPCCCFSYTYYLPSTTSLTS
ncbi:hypothetical protein TcasGA2_TC004320 [Tribolium castaneum]|uniref:Uncharacterized protein n=1 Tax=Tribolium castaneum TaxID=7070 RepID=D6X131_TRICA|nr:hypothetical protein TcasGA2_TC004320 [Tribolium castaneum]